MGARLNYRHAFHAGNFADLMKHAILLLLLDRLTTGGPLTVVDTHAGAGVYDLEGDAAQTSQEAREGVLRLLDAARTPEPFGPLLANLGDANPDGGRRWYPGSPGLIVGALRKRDCFVGCELRADDYAALRNIRPMAARRGVLTTLVNGDGYGEAIARAALGKPTLAFVDPPFERGDEYDRIVHTAGAVAGYLDTRLAIWAPLKDLETFDALVRRLQDLGLASAVVVELRLRPLTNPMRMNGCAMILIGCPDVSRQALEICKWIAATLGDAGAEARAYALDRV